MKKQIVKTIAIAFLFILSASIWGTPSVASQEIQYPPRAYIFIDPASKGAATKEVFNVNVEINADSWWDIAGYDVTVEYDSTTITLLNETEGGFLKQGGTSTFGYYFNTSNSIEAVFTKLSDSVPSGGVDTLFTLQFNVTCQFSHQPISCNLELNNTNIVLWSHPERNFPPYDVGNLAIAPQLLYDPRPAPTAAPYTHYTVGGTFSVNLGDINNDGTIDLQDLVSLANAYGSHCANYHYQGEPASPNWNERADLACPFGQIGLTDLVTFEVYYNKRANDWFIQGKGTVKYVGLEGGFYGIVGDDGNGYDPINMPQEFKVDGLRVQFTANLTNFMSIHLWGYVVKLLSIERLP